MKGPGRSPLDRFRIAGSLSPRLWFLLACVVLVAIAFLPLAKRARERRITEEESSRSPAHTMVVPGDLAVLDAGDLAVPDEASASPPVGVAPVASGPIKEARAYQLVLNGTMCQLKGIQDLRGDFKRVRAIRRSPGMISCRLLDAGGHLLAEETMPAPDEACLVLDPNVPGPKGEATPAMLAPGGETVFQTRLPKVAGAVTLEVLRLSGGNGATPDARPPGELLASIRLPQS